MYIVSQKLDVKYIVYTMYVNMTVSTTKHITIGKQMPI